jgi:hypothetical protein
MKIIFAAAAAGKLRHVKEKRDGAVGYRRHSRAAGSNSR